MMVKHRAVLLPAPDMPGWDDLPDGEQERSALPARFHIPVWTVEGEPKMWVCAVCWGDGWQTRWPCETAAEHGGEVLEGERVVRLYLAALEDAPRDRRRPRATEPRPVTPDPLAVKLAEIRDRNEQWITRLALTEASVADSPSGDLRRALAALEAVLEVHAPDRIAPDWCAACGFNWPCSAVQAISRALLGEETGDGGS